MEHECVHETAIKELQDEATRQRIWRSGNGAPHRGAEARITRIEEGAVMRDDIQTIIERAVSQRSRSVAAILTACAPYAVMAILLLVWLVTGKPPQVPVP